MSEYNQRKMIGTEAEKKRLENLGLRLRKYCHVNGCTDYFGCPAVCDCEKELDLDTNIAWKIADIIDYLIEDCYIGKGSKFFTFDNTDEIITGIKKVSFINGIILQRVHHSKYKELWSLIQQVQTITNRMLCNLEELLKFVINEYYS